jgi:membrane protease YdiL (CAAX protease family)
VTDGPALTPVAASALALEAGLLAAGVWLWWRCLLCPAARARPAPVRLAPWPIVGSDFILLLIVAMLGACFVSAAAGLLLRLHPLGPDAALVLGGGALHLGVLGGLALYYHHFRREPPSPRPALAEAWRTGLVTCLIALPLVLAVGRGAEALVRACGLPDDQQELVDLLEHTHSIAIRTGLVVVATLIVPITEELVFRAGLYRYFRTRMPRGLALGGTALLFGSLHVDWVHLSGLSSLLPLTALAVIFSLAYERTGNIGTTMVAHALFNLNTFVLVFTGAGS